MRSASDPSGPPIRMIIADETARYGVFTPSHISSIQLRPVLWIQIEIAEDVFVEDHANSGSAAGGKSGSRPRSIMAWRAIAAKVARSLDLPWRTRWAWPATPAGT